MGSSIHRLVPGNARQTQSFSLQPETRKKLMYYWDMLIWIQTTARKYFQVKIKLQKLKYLPCATTSLCSCQKESVSLLFLEDKQISRLLAFAVSWPWDVNFSFVPNIVYLFIFLPGRKDIYTHHCHWNPGPWFCRRSLFSEASTEQVFLSSPCLPQYRTGKTEKREKPPFRWEFSGCFFRPVAIIRM